jgi:anti-sigma factor RsiW
MRCRDFVELIRARLDDELSSPEIAEFERHAAQCARCASYFVSYRNTMLAAKTAFEEDDGSPLPEEVVNETLGVLRRSCRKSQ